MKNSYNLGDPGFLSNPAPMLSKMRAEASLVKVKLPIIGSIWVTTTYAATSQVAKTKETFFLTGLGAGLKKKGNVGLPWWAPPSFRAMAENMLGKDDPEHRRLRKLVDQAFVRRGIRDMRPNIAKIAQARVESLGSGTVNIVPGFCRAFPLEVIADLLGVADEDREAFASMGNAMVDFNGGLFAIFKMVRTIGKFWHFVGQMVRDMRINPQPGLVTDLIEVEAEGEQLTEDELVSMIFLLMFAGFETTTHLISGSVIALDQNPDQRAWLFTDFENRIESATEELCRFVSSVSGTKPRIAANDIEVDGQLIKKGDKVMALPIAANYDPAVFDQPEILRLDRFPNPHLSFSTGSHFCLGMQLARVELQEALRALYTNHSALRVSEPATYAKRPGFRGIKHLNVALP